MGILGPTQPYLALMVSVPVARFFFCQKTGKKTLVNCKDQLHLDPAGPGQLSVHAGHGGRVQVPGDEDRGEADLPGDLRPPDRPVHGSGALGLVILCPLDK